MEYRKTNQIIWLSISKTNKTPLFLQWKKNCFDIDSTVYLTLYDKIRDENNLEEFNKNKFLPIFSGMEWNFRWCVLNWVFVSFLPTNDSIRLCLCSYRCTRKYTALQVEWYSNWYEHYFVYFFFVRFCCLIYTHE